MRRISILMIAAALALGAVQKDTRAQAQLQAAINKETVEGDLKAAIELYRKLAQAGDRAVAAKALVRMGQCYEKLGDAEARKAYERAIREFGDQKEAVATARARLAALGGTKAAEGMSLRHVDTGDRFQYLGGISADGRLIAYSDPDSGSQAVYDTATRQEKVLVKLTWDGPDLGGRNGEIRARAASAGTSRSRRTLPSATFTRLRYAVPCRGPGGPTPAPVSCQQSSPSG